MRAFAIDFIQTAFSPLIENVYHEIYKSSSRLEENDKVYYFVLMTFGM